MSVPKDHDIPPSRVADVASRVDLNDAFNASDDEDERQFDFRAAAASFRARLTEQDASFPTGKDVIEDKNSTWGPNIVMRRSADVESEAQGSPRSSLNIPSNEGDNLNKSPSLNHSTRLDGIHSREQVKTPEPATRYEKSEDEQEVTNQAFEDVSLEEEPQTPPSVPPLNSKSPQILAQPSRPSSGAANQFPENISSMHMSESKPVNASSFQEQFRPSKNIGSTALQQVISKTRPTYLPPKSREEDVKHLKDWEDMMKKSRQAEEKRKQELLKRRQAREQAIEESIPRWQREVLPDWKKVQREPNLRHLWWQGIPPKLRGQLWEKAVGNPLQLSKESYKICLSRGQRAIDRGTFPQDSLAAMEEDMDATLPSLHLFHRELGAMRQDLKELMIAWTVARSDEGLGYKLGAARIGAMLLLNIPPPRTFVTMRNLMDRHCLRSLYGDDATKDDVEAYFRIFDTLLADSMPKVYFNFKQHQISPSEYLPQWFMALFLDHLPFEATARLWDIILLEGDSFLFRSALAIFGVLESRLFFPDRDELLQVLRGESRAAMEVAKRAKRVSIVGQFSGRTAIPEVDLGARYEVYGLDEETLWNRIESSEEWWRESTWARLIQRELPDL